MAAPLIRIGRLAQLHPEELYHTTRLVASSRSGASPSSNSGPTRAKTCYLEADTAAPLGASPTAYRLRVRRVRDILVFVKFAATGAASTDASTSLEATITHRCR